MQQKHEQDMKAMREEMNKQFSQIMSICIDCSNTIHNR
jgi:hypothetical protein